MQILFRMEPLLACVCRMGYAARPVGSHHGGDRSYMYVWGSACSCCMQATLGHPHSQGAGGRGSCQPTLVGWEGGLPPLSAGLPLLLY